MSYYALILLGTIAGPLALSFERKIRFIQYWRPLLVSVSVMAFIFLIWDEWFVGLGIWGFNEQYVGSIKLMHLPLEEVLFFWVVPFSCIFTYEVVKGFVPEEKLVLLGRATGFTLALSALILAMLYTKHWYTLLACSVAAVCVIGLCFQLKVRWFGHFALAFLLCLIPFLLVNGLLTGMATPEPVVWYNEDHIIGVRLGTIPLEDIFFNCALMLPTVTLYEQLKVRWVETKNAPTE